MSYTSDDIIRSIKRGITVPNFQSLLTDEDILQFIDEETLSYIVPILMSLRSEFLVQRELVQIVNSQSEYTIPYRALGRVLRNLNYLLDGNRVRLFYVQPEDIVDINNNGTAGTPKGFCFRGDKVQIIPVSANTDAFMEFEYHVRPSKLCSVSAAGKVTNFDLTLKTVTLDKLPANASSAGLFCDIIQGKQGCTLLDYDVEITNVTGLVFTLDRIPAGIAKGDWVCETERSPVLQIPEEGMQVLAQSVQCRVLEAIGDTEGFQTSKSRLEEKVRHFKDLLTPRSEGATNRVTNRTGLLRTRRRFF